MYARGQGIILNEPTVIALNTRTHEVLALGADAWQMIGRTPGYIVAVRPLRGGAITDFEITQRLIRMLFQRAGISRLQRARVLICVPSAITHVEQRAVLEAARRAGAAQTFLIEQPMAAAIGASLPIHEPLGNMIVDIGGGTSEVAVISLGGVVALEAVRVGSFDIDATIQSYVRREYGLAIGERTAEEVKLAIGSVFPTDDEYKAEVRGRDLMSGMPKVDRAHAGGDPRGDRRADPADPRRGRSPRLSVRRRSCRRTSSPRGSTSSAAARCCAGSICASRRRPAVRGAARRSPARDGRARRRALPRELRPPQRHVHVDGRHGVRADALASDPHTDDLARRRAGRGSGDLSLVSDRPQGTLAQPRPAVAAAFNAAAATVTTSCAGRGFELRPTAAGFPRSAGESATWPAAFVVLVIIWQWRSQTQRRARSVATASGSRRAWGIAGWFIPFANLVDPVPRVPGPVAQL